MVWPLKLDERAWDNYIRARRYREGQEYLQLTSRLDEIAGPGARSWRRRSTGSACTTTRTSDIYVYERVERQYGMTPAQYLDEIRPDLVITDAKIATERRVERLLYNELDARAKYELIVRHKNYGDVAVYRLDLAREGALTRGPRRTSGGARAPRRGPPRNDRCGLATRCSCATDQAVASPASRSSIATRPVNSTVSPSGTPAIGSVQVVCRSGPAVKSRKTAQASAAGRQRRRRSAIRRGERQAHGRQDDGPERDHVVRLGDRAVGEHQGQEQAGLDEHQLNVALAAQRPRRHRQQPDDRRDEAEQQRQRHEEGLTLDPGHGVRRRREEAHQRPVDRVVERVADQRRHPLGPRRLDPALDHGRPLAQRRQERDDQQRQARKPGHEEGPPARAPRQVDQEHGQERLDARRQRRAGSRRPPAVLRDQVQPNGDQHHQHEIDLAVVQVVPGDERQERRPDGQDHPVPADRISAGPQHQRQAGRESDHLGQHPHQVRQPGRQRRPERHQRPGQQRRIDVAAGDVLGVHLDRPPCTGSRRAAARRRPGCSSRSRS